MPVDTQNTHTWDDNTHESNRLSISHFSRQMNATKYWVGCAPLLSIWRNVSRLVFISLMRPAHPKTTMQTSQSPCEPMKLIPLVKKARRRRRRHQTLVFGKLASILSNTIHISSQVSSIVDDRIESAARGLVERLSGSHSHIVACAACWTDNPNHTQNTHCVRRYKRNPSTRRPR